MSGNGGGAASVVEREWEQLLKQRPVLPDTAEAFWRLLHADGPAHRVDGAVLVNRFDAVDAVLRDAERFSSRQDVGASADEIRSSLGATDLASWEETQRFRRYLMAREDDPQHRRLRAVAHRAFTPRRIGGLEAAIEAYMEELLEDVEGAGVLNVSDLSYRLPLMAIGDLLDVPPSDRELMHEWTQQYVTNLAATDTDSIGLTVEAIRNFQGYSEDILATWRAAPETSDLVASLTDDGDPLTPDELAGTFMQLILAGHETTTHLISKGLYALLSVPDQWSDLCSDPHGLAVNATEELLRYVVPLQWQSRVARSRGEICGVEFEAGTTIHLMLAAANRDPEVFADPDRLDVRRENARQHLTFGIGPHFCLGASLARLEGQVAFRSLASRFPDMTLGAEVEWVGHAGGSGIAGFTVAL
jgi:cytochrome P450